MSDVNVKLKWEDGNSFTGTSSGGHVTKIDGNRESGASPMDILLEAVGSCSAIDVVVIMEKVRTPLARLEITLEGDRHSPEPRYYTDISMRFDAWGDGINQDKLERAINLSITKYCSVFHSLRPDINFVVEYRINSDDGDYKSISLA